MKKENLITILIVIFVVLFGVLYIERNRVNNVVFIPNETQKDEAAQDKSIYNNEENIDKENTKYNNSLVVRPDWGIQFLHPEGWKITENTTDKIVMKTAYDDHVIVNYIEGVQIKDSDAKFGNVTYYYDSEKDKWMRTGAPINVGSGDGSGDTLEIETTIAIPSMYTENSLPIFDGVGRWKTFIIPLSPNSFIKMNITGSGDTKQLIDLVSTIDTLN